MKLHCGLAAQKHLLRGLFTADADVTNSIAGIANPNLGTAAGCAADPARLRRSIRDLEEIMVHPTAEPSLAEAARSTSARCPTSAGATWRSSRLCSGRRRSTDATACVSTRAASALLTSTSASFPAKSSINSSTPLLCGPRADAICNRQLRSASSTSRPLGRQQVFDLTEPLTHSFIANGITVHNCSEYMFLDDTACNLASLNVLTFFDAEIAQL